METHSPKLDIFCGSAFKPWIIFYFFLSLPAFLCMYRVFCSFLSKAFLPLCCSIFHFSASLYAFPVSQLSALTFLSIREIHPQSGAFILLSHPCSPLLLLSVFLPSYGSVCVSDRVVRTVSFPPALIPNWNTFCCIELWHTDKTSLATMENHNLLKDN